MALVSFRALLEWLEARGELARVARAVDPAFERTAVLRKTQKGPNVGLLFESVTGSPLRVATNAMSRRATTCRRFPPGRRRPRR